MTKEMKESIKIKKLMDEGHSFYCACRMVWKPKRRCCCGKDNRETGLRQTGKTD